MPMATASHRSQTAPAFVPLGVSDPEDEQRLRVHAVSAELTQLLLGDLDQRDALLLIARRAREVTGARIGAVLLPGDDPDLQAYDGPAELRQHLDDPSDDVLGHVVVEPLPPGTSGATGSLLVAGGPIDVGQATELAKVFAAHATLALDRAQARREHAMIAVLEDRDRIARDLHDLVIQRLFATGLQLQSIGMIVNAEAQERLTRAVEDIDATIRDLRAAIFELHHRPARRSLRADIQALVEEYTEPLGFRPQLSCSGPIDAVVPPAVRPQILAAIREALSNVVRHAEAGAVTVEVTATATEVVARVADDGIGITPGDRRSGLANLQDRAEALGGTVRLERNQPRGTTLELRAPLDGLPLG
jgi:signal transduction histidine kinase